MTLAFHLACVPPKTSFQAKRIVKVGQWSKLADKPELVKAKEMLDALLLPHQPQAPIRGAVALRLEFTYPWLAGHGKRLRECGRIPHTSRPDASNLAKTIEDRLAALLFIEDDANVVELRVRKYWGDRPGIAVAIEEVNGAVPPLL